MLRFSYVRRKILCSLHLHLSRSLSRVKESDYDIYLNDIATLMFERWLKNSQLCGDTWVCPKILCKSGPRCVRTGVRPWPWLDPIHTRSFTQSRPVARIQMNRTLNARDAEYWPDQRQAALQPVGFSTSIPRPVPRKVRPKGPFSSRDIILVRSDSIIRQHSTMRTDECEIWSLRNSSVHLASTALYKNLHWYWT